HPAIQRCAGELPTINHVLQKYYSSVGSSCWGAKSSCNNWIRARRATISAWACWTNSSSARISFSNCSFNWSWSIYLLKVVAPYLKGDIHRARAGREDAVIHIAIGVAVHHAG